MVFFDCQTECPTNIKRGVRTGGLKKEEIHNMAHRLFKGVHITPPVASWDVARLSHADAHQSPEVAGFTSCFMYADVRVESHFRRSRDGFQGLWFVSDANSLYLKLKVDE